MESLVIWFAVLLLIHFLFLLGSSFIQSRSEILWQDKEANQADFTIFKVFTISLRNYFLDYGQALQFNLQNLALKKISFRTAFVGIILSQENFVLLLFSFLLIGKINFYWVIVAGGILWGLGGSFRRLRTPGILIGGLGAFLFLANELFVKVTVLRSIMGGEQLGMIFLDKTPENLWIFMAVGLVLGSLLGAIELLVAIVILLMAGLMHLYVAVYFASALLIGQRMAKLWSLRLAFRSANAGLIFKSEMIFVVIDFLVFVLLAPLALAYLTIFGGEYDPYLRADQWIAIMIAFQILSLGLRSTWAHFYYKINAKKLEALI